MALPGFDDHLDNYGNPGIPDLDETGWYTVTVQSRLTGAMRVVYVHVEEDTYDAALLLAAKPHEDGTITDWWDED